MRISDWSSDVCFFRSKTPTPELRLIMTAFQAFAPIPQETTINGSAGRLVLASDDEKILISGDIEIAANETGLAAALHLRDMLNAVIDNISGRTSGNLSIEPPVSPIKKKNPFD